MAGMWVPAILNMVNHETNELFFENLQIPADILSYVAEHVLGLQRSF